MTRVVYNNVLSVFFFNDTATTEIYTYGHPLSLHDALPICTIHHRERGIDMVPARQLVRQRRAQFGRLADLDAALPESHPIRRRHCHRSEEHTSELQSLMRISYAVFCLKQKINHRDY